MIRPGLPRLLLCIALVFSASVFPLAPALADRKEEAHAAEARATKAFGKTEYQAALDEYNASYTKYPKPYLLVKIADCQRLLDRPSDALYNYKKYLAKVAKGTDRRKVLAYVAELEPIVAALKPKVAAAPVVEAAPAPQVNDVEAPPMSAEALARKQREEERLKKGKLDEVSANVVHGDEPMPPGFDPANLVPDPTDPKIPPPPSHVYPPGYKPPVYRRWWPWTILGVGVVVGAGIGLGLAFGLPKFNSELPTGGPGAALTVHALKVSF